MHDLDLTLADISKIEGKASCSIKMRNGNVEEVKFVIAEYKRFYTQAIRGKDLVALPQLTARICGTCSNAHLLCAIQAVENAIGLVPTSQTIFLRKLLNYGLLIRDHALHLYVFVLPDLLGKDSILDFDENNPEEHKYLDDTFSIKSVGNHLSQAVAGRSVHAPFAAVGGFTLAPKQDDLSACVGELERIRPKVLDIITFFADNDRHLVQKELEFAAVMDREYSFLSGELLRTNGRPVSSFEYGKFLNKVMIPHSQATGFRFENKVYMVGALARMNLGKENLHENTKKDAASALSLFPSWDIFHNNLAQAIEILHAIDSSLTILRNLTIVPEKPIPPVRKKGKGIGIIEAPRGALYYELTIDDLGKITDGRIVVPTGQNQICIEESIKRYLETIDIEKLAKEEIELEIERIVRAFDPCMSCASHFLRVNWK
jgi:sulfhydrogenase subunit alpha